MTKTLKLAANLELPLDFTTERIAFLARTGAGKSGGMRVLAEQLIDAGQFVVQLDLRAGDMWGIRAAGLKAGYPVVVMGGEHGDIPLQPTAGKFVAEFLNKERVSTVLDLSDFTKADATRFVTAFATRFYEVNREVVHLIIDEVDVVAGERNYDPHCLEAIQYLMTKARKRGIGVTISTQRTAMTNKTVLGQAGTLIAMQQMSPRDIKSVREYLDAVAEPDVVRKIVSTLPMNKPREAIVYSPQYLGAEPRKITFDSFKTFDSMATPKPGQARRAPGKLADIDLSAVQKEMASTIEAAKANDPAELKKRVRELEAQLHAKPSGVDQVLYRGLQESLAQWQGHAGELKAENLRLRDRMVRMINIIHECHVDAEVFPPKATRELVAKFNGPLPKSLANPAPASKPIKTGVIVRGERLGRCEGAIIAALKFCGGSASKRRVALVSRYSITSSGFSNALSSLRSGGLISHGEPVTLLPAGHEAADEFPDAIGGEEMRRYWITQSHLGKCERAVLEAVCNAYPNSRTKEEIAEAACYSVTSSGFKNALSTLRGLELISGSGQLKAASELFE